MTKQERKKQILELHNAGIPTKEIAERLNLKSLTVNAIINNSKRIGDKHPGWNGGIKWSMGYCWIKKIGESNHYTKRANIVLEAKIGRKLQPGEIAHHINEDRSDDSPDNLEVKLRGIHQMEHNIDRMLRGELEGTHSHQKRDSKGIFRKRDS